MWGKTNILSLKFSREGSARPLFNQCQSRSSRVKISFTTRIGCVFLKLHQCSFCLWWHQYPIVYLIPSQEETADYICSVHSKLYPSFQVIRLTWWLYEAITSSLPPWGQMKLRSWWRGRRWWQYVRAHCNEWVPVQRFNVFQYNALSDLKCGVSRAGPGEGGGWQGKWHLSISSAAREGKEDTTGHCLKQMGKKRQYICIWKGGRQYWVNAYSWDWNWLLAVISCK